jgi:hypothetical protein
MSKDEVKRAVRDYLEARGWAVQVAWGRTPGVDVQATRAGRTLLIEAVGDAATDPHRTNNFLRALAELLQRMDAGDKHYSLAFPEQRTYVRLTRALPTWVKRRLRLQFFFVSSDSKQASLSHETD